MLGVPATVSRITRAWAKWRGSASLLASRVTSWLPTNVSGRNAAAKLSCRSSAQASSKKVAVVQGAPDGLPQLVLGHAVQAALADRRDVIAVDQLAGEPRLRVIAAHPAGDGTPESQRHRLPRPQPPSVNAACQPMAQHARDIVLHRGLAVVECHQAAVSLEVRVPEPVGAAGLEVQPKPGRVA